MYWNNPLTRLEYPSEQDPIKQNLHHGRHCLFYNPAVSKHLIHSNQTLGDLCNWANNGIKNQSLSGFLDNSNNHYDMANLVKLNLWVKDLQVRGSVKPMLLHYTGQEKFATGTGESRLRAMERIDSITHVSAFISTHSQFRDFFGNLEMVESFDHFAKICQAVPGQQFLFRLTDAQAPYGLDWYEYNSKQTETVTPGQDWCVEVLGNYLKQHPTHFTPEWFDTLVTWDYYKNSQ